jgi:hypothetical protein
VIIRHRRCSRLILDPAPITRTKDFPNRRHESRRLPLYRHEDAATDLANLGQGEGVELAVGRLPFGHDAASTFTAPVHATVG